ncbi:maltokinase [Streptomyces sp. ODS28]|uniref:maltokinase N-terminal cap-like domain-containing protein n=1 Tax=Streptomyces sp. ODS28 TaxID=3136688 RepID=UPI0031EF8A9E
MSESSLPLTAVPHSSALLSSLSPLLAQWLPRQRWFAGKGRPVRDFTLVSATEILPMSGRPAGLLHLLVRARQTPVPHPAEAEAPDGGAAHADCYQLLLGVRETAPPELAPAVLGRAEGGPLDGRTVYDALHDPRLTAVLLERLRTPGALGPLRFGRAPDAPLPSGLTARPLAAEQSNSSVVYGDAYILKLFRRVSPGVNPDLELPRALARRDAVGSERVPAPVAWYETAAGEDGEPMTLGVLQPFLPGTRDGWQLALEALGGERDFTADSYALGRATAEVHTGLAEALPVAELDREHLEGVAAQMTERLEAAAVVVPALRPYVSGLRGAFADLVRATGPCRAQRVHGDLHLGQTLRNGDGHWSLIDFEGEPARPLAERRRPQPPVRDVAGMLRSFDYAACQSTGGSAVAEEWAVANRHAYCAGYAEAAGADPREDAALLRAYETDKAVYEVLYEARHRPDWLPVPLAAVGRLADSPTLRRF